MNNKPLSCLLLEDDADDREMFMEALRSVSDTVACHAVTNGAEAMDVLERGSFSPDYIFSDINMPLMDGMEFLKRIKRLSRFRNIPVIFYTSDYTEGRIAQARTSGAAAVFEKSRISTLREILKKYFADETHTIL